MKQTPQTYNKALGIFLVLFLALSASTTLQVEAQEPSGSITFQPSEMPNMQFDYIHDEYRFELRWKDYYLYIKPFAIYNGEYYELKQIIPWLKNNYPNIDYYTAIQRFKNYHRWGFWLEKLPQNVADDLDYLGFELEHNIPLNVIEIEEIEDYNFTFKRIHIANKFTLDFYDLYERGFEVSINKTTILIGNVNGKTEIDLDPVTYAAPKITVTGTNGGTPWNFWDLWNASYINGWNVSSQTCENATTGLGQQDTQFLFNCTMDIGDGVTATEFADINRQITFPTDLQSATHQNYIVVKNNAEFTLGTELNSTDKTSEAGCSIIFLEDNYHSSYYINNQGGTTKLLSSIIVVPNLAGRGNLQDDMIIWNSMLIGHIAINQNGNTGDIYNVIFNGGWNGIIASSAPMENTHFSYVGQAIHYQGATSGTARNPVIIRDAGDDTLHTWIITVDQYLIDYESNRDMVISWGGANTGEIYEQYTFNVVVVDKDGNPVENADVTLTYSGQGGGTVGSWSTPENGSIPEQTISKGFYNQTGGDTIYPYEPYNLTIEATGYLTQTFIFNVSEPITWNVPLIETEDGIVTIIQNAFNIELLILAGLSTLFTFVAWNDDPKDGIVRSAMAFFLWSTTSLWWMWETAGTEQIHFMYVFWMLALVSVMLFLSKLMQSYRYVGKKGAWIE